MRLLRALLPESHIQRHASPRSRRHDPRTDGNRSAAEREATSALFLASSARPRSMQAPRRCGLAANDGRCSHLPMAGPTQDPRMREPSARRRAAAWLQRGFPFPRLGLALPYRNHRACTTRTTRCSRYSRPFPSAREGQRGDDGHRAHGHKRPVQRGDRLPARRCGARRRGNHAASSEPKARPKLSDICCSVLAMVLAMLASRSSMSA